MPRTNRHTKKIIITEKNLIGLDEVIASIPKDLKKSMVLYITTWQEVPDDPQETNTMTTKPEWFKEFEQEQNKRWEEQNKRWEKQEKFNKMQEKRWEEQRKCNERILSLVEKIIHRIDNLVVKNNLKE